MDLPTQEVSFPKSLQNVLLALDLNFGWDSYNMRLAMLPDFSPLEHLGLRFRDEQSAAFTTNLMRRVGFEEITASKLTVWAGDCVFSRYVGLFDREGEDGTKLKEVTLRMEDCPPFRLERGRQRPVSREGS